MSPMSVTIYGDDLGLFRRAIEHRIFELRHLISKAKRYSIEAYELRDNVVPSIIGAEEEIDALYALWNRMELSKCPSP